MARLSTVPPSIPGTNRSRSQSTIYDTGPIIAQTDVCIEPGDTPESLAERVLDRVHEFFVEKLAELVSGLEDQP